MVSPAPRWLRAVAWLVAAAFVVGAVLVYGVRYGRWLESDATVPVILGARALHSGLPFARDFYYGNGDVWVIAPHLLAIAPVAVLGVGPASLWGSTVLGFALELVVLARIYAWLGGARWLGWLAAAVTLLAWSRLHIRFVYIQLAYGYGAVLYLAVIAAFAAVASAAAAPRRRWLGVIALVVVGAVQNPTRGLVFVVAPLLVACAWPWRGLAWRRRLALAGAVGAGGAIAAGLYHAMAIDTAGNIWVWGNNSYGQMGNGTSGTNVPTPTLVTIPSGAKAISAGWYHSLAVSTLGAVFSWGRNNSGQIGNGSASATTHQTTPYQVALGLSSAKGVAAKSICMKEAPSAPRSRPSPTSR